GNSREIQSDAFNDQCQCQSPIAQITVYVLFRTVLFFFFGDRESEAIIFSNNFRLFGKYDQEGVDRRCMEDAPLGGDFLSCRSVNHSACARLMSVRL
uniref:Uncharacterized protein n=1 Tax=Anopheles atroparvus TaxID=41427 RepID=A0AAG5D050_ANOAO